MTAQLSALLLALALGLRSSAGVMPVAELRRSVQSIVATHSGSILVIAVSDEAVKHLVFATTLGSGNILWQQSFENAPTALAVSPDDHEIALGFRGVSDNESGVLLLDARTGQETGALGGDEKLEFVPGETYPRWGGGVTQLVFSPDGSLLYGLSNDTLFAWDLAVKRYLWVRDVPAMIEAPAYMADPLPIGHATGFSLSPDGRQLAAERDVLRVATVGRVRPGRFIQRDTLGSMELEASAFSADSRILAAGESKRVSSGRGTVYATKLWIGDSRHPIRIDGCGGGIAWSDTADVFACQNVSGAHLRNIHDPQKDIGAARPVSDLSIFKVGKSLWSSAYKWMDWKDPVEALPLTLVELGTGRRVTVTLPGRAQSDAGAKVADGEAGGSAFGCR